MSISIHLPQASFSGQPATAVVTSAGSSPAPSRSSPAPSRRHTLRGVDPSKHLEYGYSSARKFLEKRLAMETAAAVTLQDSFRRKVRIERHTPRSTCN